MAALPSQEAPPAKDVLAPTRPTDAGLLSGLDGTVLRFLGIPYAAPPVGLLRWRAPLPAQPWPGVRQATQFGPDCFGHPLLRKGSRAPSMSEDCLYLNVWCPPETSTPRPVLVWIYGGGFLGGSSALPYYDGTALARRGVVVVSFNYRANVFGFFAHPELSRESQGQASGNYGLLDMLAALGWVKRNISSFGGDPSRVTVFGESAGATSLGLLLTSPMSAGLFSGAILQSPGLMRPLATLAEGEVAGEQLGDLAQLRNMSATDLMLRVGPGMSVSRGLLSPRQTGPIQDGWLLPLSDADAIAGGHFARIPIIIGSNADEGRLFVKHLPVNTVAEYRKYLSTQFGGAAAATEERYPATSDNDVKAALSQLFGDTQFNHGVDAFSDTFARWNVPVWRYRFNGNVGGDRLPATHGDEIPYVFGTFEHDALEIWPSLRDEVKDADQALSRHMATAWTTFAERGDPNWEDILSWKAYGEDGAIAVFGSAGTEGSIPLK